MQVLTGHDSAETAYVVQDYPYGFTLRCKIRYWVETSKHGQRFCSQTTNPKVSGERWNAPKKSTYSLIVGMFLDENDHVKFFSVHESSSRDTLNRFKESFGEALTDYQAMNVKKVEGYLDFNEETRKRYVA